MFGFIYYGLKFVCNLIISIKEIHHDLHAEVDPHTNTYIDYKGRERDADTAAIRIWSKDKNGNEVLLDKDRNVVRNLTAEERLNKSNDLISNGSKQKAYDTGSGKDIYPKHCSSSYARVYVDLKTQEEYAVLPVEVTIDGKREKKEFYVKFSDPENLVCISDNQMKLEEIRRKYKKYNWIDHPEDERKFINYYNSLPISYDSERIPILIFEK